MSVKDFRELVITKSLLQKKKAIDCMFLSCHVRVSE